MTDKVLQKQALAARRKLTLLLKALALAGACMGRRR
jgi:hypothetical protein